MWWDDLFVVVFQIQLLSYGDEFETPFFPWIWFVMPLHDVLIEFDSYPIFDEYQNEETKFQIDAKVPPSRHVHFYNPLTLTSTIGKDKEWENQDPPILPFDNPSI